MTDTALRRKADKTVVSTIEWHDKIQARFEKDKLKIKEKFDASFFGGLAPQVAMILIGMFNHAQNAAAPMPPNPQFQPA